MKYVHIDALGKCSCGSFFNLASLPTEALDATWKCKSCSAEITPESCGMGQIDGTWRRVRWIGPGGVWVDQRPNDDFGFELEGSDKWLVNVIL